MHRHERRQSVCDFLSRLLSHYGHDAFESVPPSSSEADAVHITDINVRHDGHIDIVCDERARFSPEAGSEDSTHSNVKEGIHRPSVSQEKASEKPSKGGKSTSRSERHWSVRAVTAIAQAMTRRKTKADDDDIFAHILFESHLLEEDDPEDLEEFAKAKALLAAFLQQEQDAIERDERAKFADEPQHYCASSSARHMPMLNTAFSHSDETLIGSDDASDSDVTAVSSPVEPQRAGAPLPDKDCSNGLPAEGHMAAMPLQQKLKALVEASLVRPDQCSAKQPAATPEAASSAMTA